MRKKLKMIKFISNYFEHSDLRGSIKGLVNFGEWREINIIESKANTERGNHFHLYTEELFIILEGRIKITLHRIVDGTIDTSSAVCYEAVAGDVFLIEAQVNHLFNVLEDSKWLNVLSHPTDSTSPDINRPKGVFR